MKPIPRAIRDPSPCGTGEESSAIIDLDREVATLAKALAHPARVAIVRMLLSRGDCVCGAIVADLPLAQATVSQHLKVLKEAGIVRGEVDGPRICYCINPEAVQRLKTMLESL